MTAPGATPPIALDVDFCRAQFPPLGNGVTYLENAGGSYVPLPVMERLQAYMARRKEELKGGEPIIEPTKLPTSSKTMLKCTT